MNWILFGFKGAGKTYFGRRLGLPFIDTDEQIERKEGMSPRNICLQKGEDYFRELEKEVISSLTLSQTVIAVGGGTVLNSQNLNHLQRLGKMLYLKCPKEVVKKRMLTPPLPSFLDPCDPEGSFEKMYTTRKNKYEKIPATVVDLAGKNEQTILEELWQAIDLDNSSPSQLGESLMAKLSE